MSTFNIQISVSSWTQIAEARDTDFLVTWGDSQRVEFASTDANTVPTVNGHILPRERKISREDVGAGYVWAKLVPDNYIPSLIITVSKTGSSSGAVGGFDSVEGVHKVATMIWNPTYLQWERSTGAGGGGGGGSAALPTTKRFDKRSATELYVGSAEVGAAESSAGWGIQKITFDVNGNATASYYGVGIWNDRYSLSYA